MLNTLAAARAQFHKTAFFHSPGGANYLVLAGKIAPQKLPSRNQLVGCA
jgi:hypothetical protein